MRVAPISPFLLMTSTRAFHSYTSRSSRAEVIAMSTSKRKRSQLNGSSKSKHFSTSEARDATSLVDSVELSQGNKLPWVGFGTYKVDKTKCRSITLKALQQGYRLIDTAFIYGGETCETQVGLAIQDAISEGILQRKDLVLQSKHWRKYHGYEPTMECLRLSLKRLQLDYIDVWLIHWPGPAWNTMNRRNDLLEEHGPWFYATHNQEDLPSIRAETWRAMEDAVKAGKIKAIGVSNFSINHLEQLKKTATIWPPAVNQIECHPMFPQTDLVRYCEKEGIVVQAYASLGGQDVGKSFWRKLYNKPKKEAVTKLVNSPPVIALAQEVKRTPAQVLLRWALEKNIAIVPKSSSIERMEENSNIFDFSLSTKQMESLESQLQSAIATVAEEEGESIEAISRLCWRRDPLRNLDFD